MSSVILAPLSRSLFGHVVIAKDFLKADMRNRVECLGEIETNDGQRSVILQGIISDIKDRTGDVHGTSSRHVSFLRRADEYLGSIFESGSNDPSDDLVGDLQEGDRSV